MNSELPVSADALLAERARLEEELQSSEDWCELLRLKSRKDRGEGMSAVNAARLEMVLIDALSEDPNFVRYKAVCVALERLIRGLPPLPPARSKREVERDDLTQIRGVTASMARRLNALDVTTFAQIADWRGADIQSISADLGIGKQIYAQNWIEQAAQLAKPGGDKPAVSGAAPSEPASRRDRPTAPPAPTPGPSSAQFVQPVSVREAAAEKPPVHLSRVAAVQAILREVMPETAVEKPSAPAVTETAKQPSPSHAPAAKHSPASAPLQAASQVRPQPEPPAQAKLAMPPVANTPATAPSVAVPPMTSDEPVKGAAKQAQQPVITEPADVSVEAQQQAEKPKTKSPPATPERTMPVPPAPLRPNNYGKVPEQPVAPVSPDSAGQTPVAAVVAPPASMAALTQPARPLPIPPMPLRVQAPPRVADGPANIPANDALKSDATKPAVAAAEPPLRAPPRPFVVTRASLPPPPAPQPAPKTVAAPAIVPSPTQPTKPGAQPSSPPPLAASTPGSTPVAPAMSIAEAIAYAAEVARQGPRPPQAAKIATGRDGSEAANPAVPPVAKAEPPIADKRATGSTQAAPSGPRPPAKVVAQTPAIPPPLPAGFVPPEPPPAEPEPPRVRATTVQAPRSTDRDDLAGYRLNAEEATVEIVVKSPSEPPPPRVALAKVSAETTAAAPPRAATPIGRFLKALTGN